MIGIICASVYILGFAIMFICLIINNIQDGYHPTFDMDHHLGLSIGWPATLFIAGLICTSVWVANKLKQGGK